MNESYKQKNKNEMTREAIIGMGEDSFRKNYYPELQDKILDLERINSRNKALIMTIPDMLFVSDNKGHISPFTVSQKNENPLVMRILRNREVMADLREQIQQVVETRQLATYHFSIDLELRTHHLEARIHISELEEILMIVRDMTEQVVLERQLRDLADKDTLTNLYNRRWFENYIKSFNQKETELMTLLLLDIDGLKMVNDTLGHMAGDYLLVAVSCILEQNFKNLGSVSRVGGDEFAIVIQDLDSDEIELLLKEMNEKVRQYNEGVNGTKISLSYGVATHEAGPMNVELIFQEADNNMYQNKLLKTTSIHNNHVKTLMKALEAKDYITEGHADRMDDLATKIGNALHLPQNMLDRIQLLTKFHDIGKVGIPDSILKKEGSLNTDEWKVMRTHSSIGERIANESTELRDIAHLILKHHERWDGTGYPLNLAQKNIPLECRILAIVDAFDAMTNDRPYRKALPIEVAITEIETKAGSQFDPELVTIFKAIIWTAYEPT